MKHPSIRKAAVIGSGVMGAGIAAHLANAGIETLLLDIVPAELTEEEAASGLDLSRPSVRNRLAEAGKCRLLAQKPSPLYAASVLDSIRTGNLEDDLHRLAEADWIIEAIVERLDAKRELFAKLEPHVRPGAIVSSNTSGISIRAMAEGRSEPFRRAFAGTHFFNPPRYMELVELIPTPDTSAETMERLRAACEDRLGKTVVLAKDTPNFIANRIGAYGLLSAVEAMSKHGLTVSDVDRLTGPAIGRPKSATFRTLDLVGLDTFVYVADNVSSQTADAEERKAFELPPMIGALVRQGALGEKAGRGFYKVERGPEGKTILQYDPEANAYVPQSETKFAGLEAAKQAKSPAAKWKAMLGANDAGAAFLWETTKRTLLYAAAKAPEIADDPASVDQAMKAGFHWELGPFELWDALGFAETCERMTAEGESLPEWVERLRREGAAGFYEERDGEASVALPVGARMALPQQSKQLRLSALKRANGVIMHNSGASLIDIGDGVACLEMHSLNQTIGPDVMQLFDRALEEVRRNYVGLVVGHQRGKNFCVGANLMLLLMEAQEGNWPEIRRMIQRLQGVATAMKYFEKPVVAAPFGMTLGGGVELILPASHVQASAETYMGLVEVGVGVIPAGGGTKEMLWRAIRRADIDGRNDVQPYVNRVFETIGMAKVSTSAEEAKELGLLRETDGVSLHPGRLLADAKQAVIRLAEAGYRPPRRRDVRVTGEPGYALLKLSLYQMACAGRISEHDRLIGEKLAYVLSGGAAPAGAEVSEQYVLELEQEAFLSLCGEPKTQARMQHMLLKRKPLRN